MNPDSIILWLLAIPLISSPVIYLVGRINVRRGAGQGSAAPARWLALAALLVTWIPLVIAGQIVLTSGQLRGFVGGVPVNIDGISLLLAGTALTLGSLVLLFSIPYMSGEAGEEKYYALLPLLVGTIIGLGCANDLFNLWVWFEAMAVSSYLLVAFYTHERGALEAGVKYLVQSAVGSVLVLIAIAIIFSQARTLRLDSIASAYAEINAGSGPLNSIILAAGALFLVGFGVKTAMVPMHTWLPDAHSQAPSGISAMLSGVVIEAGLVAMLRSLGNMPGGMPAWGGILLGFGALNMLVGNLMALRQTQIKRLLAYSSLSHIGYMLLGFGAAAVFHQPDAAAGGFFHLFTHALMKGLAFLAAGVFLYGLHISRGDHVPLMVDDLNGAARRYPLAAFGLSVAVLALGGLPPLAGFMSKWQIFVGAVDTRSLPVIGLVVFAAFNSVLSLAYYAPLVNRMYRCNPSKAVLLGNPVSRVMSVPLVLLIAAVVVLGFWPTLVQGITYPAANSLVSMFSSQPIAWLP
jgi:proton-translocating NADH-quinone oxidoreductase chain N